MGEPILFVIEYKDGLRAHILELNGAVGEWAVAWRNEQTKEVKAFWCYTQEARPGMHFTYLLHGIEDMMLTGQASWPVERTLLTSGALDALLASRSKDSRRLLTPYLQFGYESGWRWRQPPPPPRGRPWAQQ